MNYKITAPEELHTAICLPVSKSIGNRSLILKALSGMDLTDEYATHCDDMEVMLKALQKPKAKKVNIGAAGTAMRFLTAYFAVQEGRKVTIDGTERMRQRPIKVLVDALRECGADIQYEGEEGFPPLLIKGKQLQADEISISGEISSQYISAILMIAPLVKGFKKLHLTGEVVSRPYIDMTLRMMRKFGVKTQWEGNTIVFEEGTQYIARYYFIEGDWSAASYWFEIASLYSKVWVTLHTLFPYGSSVQGDSVISEIFEKFGMIISYGGSGADILNTDKEFALPEKLELDLSKTPDLAQTVVVTACLHEVPFHITGLKTLKIKETDRIEALRTQLLKMGYVLTVGDDLSLSWDGTKCPQEKVIRIETFDDHRMAMAFAPAAIKFKGIIINDVEVVSKSYPNYWRDLDESGFTLEEVK